MKSTPAPVYISVSNAIGSTLNITRITRMHMGTYVCEANNGIPPTARQNFEVQVHCKYSNIQALVYINIQAAVFV